MERRKNIRINAVGMKADISDRKGFSTGVLKDISRVGVCITDIPRKLHTRNNFVAAIISAKGKRFKLQLQPQWEKQDGQTMVTGAIIGSAPWGWTEMIIQLEPQLEDAWASNL